mmetsp:Transcript_57271/g.153326  ORF Transcript_57271/g.153326 Transcript_57271/m.153326 type:complete len:640 (-) Transcript_57271:171-2090(-)|eukprot:CAMPEP_0171229734 /NCGR_PEP_ID=MMETSP0790-20130122/39033_1 /TAXON_ID=2925 /ORGANISM="Alexandrium catenella, Strain OF101" /LENGTH=639 /DNA_ID=CAMNT_0011695923 /DNA_START=133 /DNA_END=2052 /DNA_ORIENTATION=+
MLRFEIELGPMVSGFLTGAAIFLCQRLLVHCFGERRAKTEDGGAKAKDAVGEGSALDPQECDARETGPPGEPIPEPDLEPSTEEELISTMPSRVLRRRACIAVALTLALAGVLAVGSSLRDDHSSAGGEGFAPVATASLEGASEPLVEVTESPTLSVLPPSTPLPSALAPAPTVATADAPGEPLAELFAAVAASEAPRGSGAEELSGQEEGDPAIGKVVTLKLTRQEMTLERVGSSVHVKSAYWSSITVGTPAVDFKVVFDTGSGHLILPSAYCKSATCRGHKRYRRTKSTSARDINFDGELVGPDDARDQITVNFGTGEVSGVFVEETVCTNRASRLSAESASDAQEYAGCIPLRMIMATDMSEEPFKTFHFDGVLGLGLPGLSQTPEFNFMHVVREALLRWGSRTPEVFSVFLAQHKHENSEISLGGYLSERLDGAVAWNTVVRPELGHWMLRIKAITVDGQAMSFCKEGCRAVVDTGTSLLSVPTKAFPEIYEMLRHEADPSLECKGSGPKLRIELENFTVVLEPKDYSQSQSSLPGTAAKQATSRSSAPRPRFDRNGSLVPEPEICKPMLMTMDLPEPVGPKLFVFGEPVLRKYYTVYDASETQPRVGFALARHSSFADAEARAARPEEDDARVL